MYLHITPSFNIDRLCKTASVLLFLVIHSNEQSFTSKEMAIYKQTVGLLVECILALQMASTEKLETRAVIKFCQQQGGTPSKTLKESAATHRKHAVSRTVFFNWHNCFREGTTSINDKKGRGRKKKVTPTLVTLVAKSVKNDKLLTVKPLETKFDVSNGTMQTILMRVFK